MILSFDEFVQYTPTRKTYGLFGFPIKHTISPKLHELLLQGTDYDADYIAIEVSPENLEQAYAIAKEKLQGINLTIPHKTAVIPYLDNIDKDALAIGCVNTVDFKTNNDFKVKQGTGYNTDIYGFSQSLAQDGIDVYGKNIAVLGNGGTALMVGYYLLKEEANLTFVVRDRNKGIEVTKTLNRTFEKEIKVCDFSQIENKTDIIINCTPVGMYPNIERAPIAKLPLACTYVYDCIYNPSTTKLLRLAEEKNIKCANGLDMLLLQAARAQTIWQSILFSREKLKYTRDSLLSQ